MYFFDVNCMLGEWGYRKLRFGSAEELTGEMERLGIKKALVFESGAWLNDPATGNDRLAGSIEKYDNLLPVMVMTPLLNQEFGGKNHVCDYMIKNNIKAVRLFPDAHNYSMTLWNIEKIFKLFDEFSIPVLLDFRSLEGQSDVFFERIYEIAVLYCHAPLVLLAAGYRFTRILFELMDRCPNIYLDTSTFLTFHGIEEFTKYLGSERILFGSRMPFMEAGVSVGRVLYAGIGQEDKENIAFRNAQRLLDESTLFERNRLLSCR